MGVSRGNQNAFYGVDSTSPPNGANHMGSMNPALTNNQSAFYGVDSGAPVNQKNK